ncbi:MAG TPA: hypothetical protein EYG89_04920 [Bacteroidia bacterium]|nr:hypothetical protein [Bacteroidia bacterium]
MKLKLKLLFVLITTLALNAKNDCYIYNKLYFNQDITAIENIKEVNNSTLPKSVEEFYLDSESVTLLTIDGKLKSVNLSLDKFILKDEIEKRLKNGFRLKSIKYKNKYSEKEIKNVGELFTYIDSDISRSEIFDILINSTLVFENELDDILLVMQLKIAIERNAKECIICTELNGDNFNEVQLLDLYFTKLNK